MWPKPLLCCRKFPGRAKRKTAAKQRIRSRPDCVRSIHEYQQICNKSRQQTAKLEIPFQRSRSHCRPNRFADKQNENLRRKSYAQSRRRRFAASSNGRRKAEQWTSTAPRRLESTEPGRVSPCGRDAVRSRMASELGAKECFETIRLSPQASGED